MVERSFAGEGPLVERDLPDNTFPKSSRLLAAGDFRNVFKNGRKYVTPALVFHVLGTERESSRLGLAVSRKVGKAVKRNRIKRRIRDIFRCRSRELPGSHDLVIYPRKGILERDFADYQKSFDVLFSILKRKHPKSPRK